MVGAGVLLLALAQGLVISSYGAYSVVLNDTYGWSLTTLAGGFGLLQAVVGLLSPVAGWLSDRIGPRRTCRIGVGLLGCGLLGASQARTVGQFLALVVVMGVGHTLTGILPTTVAVVRVVRDGTAGAIALLATGMAVGGMSVPLVVLVLEAHGWRATTFGAGLLVFGAGTVATAVLPSAPAPVGGDGPATDSVDLDHSEVSFSTHEALRTAAFWLLIVGHGLALLVVGGLGMHLVPHLTGSFGHSLPAASLAVTLVAGGQLTGQLGAGVMRIGDRFDKRRTAAVCMVGHAIAIGILAVDSRPGVIWAASVLHGLAWGVRGPLMSALRVDYFGQRSFGVIMGISLAAVSIGMTLGPVVTAIVVDVTGSYRPAFLALIVTSALGALTFLGARPPASPIHASHQSEQNL